MPGLCRGGTLPTADQNRSQRLRGVSELKVEVGGLSWRMEDGQVGRCYLRESQG